MGAPQRSDTAQHRTARPATRPTTRAKALAAFALYQQGVPTAVIAEQQDVTEECVRLWLKTARIEAATPDQRQVPAAGVEVPPAPKRRMAQRTVLHRAWLAVHLFGPFKALGDAMSMFWMRTVLEINELGDGEALTFGGVGDMYDSRSAFLSAHGRTEEDLSGLIRRGMLVEREDGGIAMPYRLGLRPRERAGGRMMPAALPPLAPMRPSGRAPVPGQRSFVMGMPSGASETAGPNFGADDGAADPNIWVHLHGEEPNYLGDDGGQTPNFSQNGAKFPLAVGTSTTTEESESLGGSGGSGTSAINQNLGPTQVLGPDPNFGSDSGTSAPVAVADELPWVALGIELAEMVGLDRPPTVPEAELIRGWLDLGASPDMLRGVIRTVMRRDTCPPRPALSYFDGAIGDALERGKRPPVPPPAPRPEVKQAPEIATAWDREDEENPSLATAWDNVRAALKAEVGDTGYRNWLRPMTLRGKDGDEISISLASGFVCDWVRDHYGTRVSALWLAEYPSVRRVNFCVREAPAAAP